MPINRYRYELQYVNATGAAALQPTAWYRANSLSATVADGGAISQWNDSSGNGRHITQGTANLQPTFAATGMNGHPAVRFDGTGRRFASAAALSQFLGANGIGTVFAVVNVDAAFTGEGLIWGTVKVSLFAKLDGTLERVVARSNDGVNEQVAKALTFAQGHIAMWVHDAVNVSAGVDDADTAALVSTASGAVQAADLVPVIQVGSDGISHLTGYIAEILFFNSVLTEEQRWVVTRYLSAKYGIPV